MSAPDFDEHAFQRLAELSTDALIVHARGTVLWANLAAARLMGLGAAADLMGQPVLRFVAPESLTMAAARIERMLKTGQPQPTLDETFVRADGERVQVEVSASPIGDGHILVSARDIGPRQKSEQARRVAEARARAFFDATTAAMGISHNGVHVEVNAAYARLFGFESPEALRGVPIFELLELTEHERVAENVRRRATGDAVPPSYAVNGRRRDGTPLRLEVHASSYPDGDSKMTVVVMRDVTEQHTFEAQLTASERRHRELVAQVPVGVWEYDLSGIKRIVDELRSAGVADFSAYLATHPETLVRCAQALVVRSVNAAACELVGARDQAELVANLEKIFLPEMLPDFAHELVQFANGKHIVTSEGWNGTLSGGRRWVAVRSAIVGGHESDWSRVLVTTSDLTDGLRAREEKEALQDQLRHAEKLEAIGRLAGGVAHDFNNLLAVIMSSIEVSRSEVPASASMTESLDLIHEASLRARDLVSQILTFGRKDKPKPTPLDISATLDEALTLARAAIPSTVTFTRSIDAQVGTVLADRTQVHQVVLNLCANARDAVGPTGSISVSLTRVTSAEGAPRARLTVVDDGVGMDEAMRARLFEPYLTTKTLGHGLGLAVVHGIVTGAGGTIEVESAKGKGTRFDLHFPLLETPSEAKPALLETVGGHERVLLVEDQPMVRSALRRLLTSLGYVVTEASDGQEALDRVRSTPTAFDLVLSDQTMPRLSGLELAKALLAELPNVRVLLCTGFSEHLDEASALKLGVRGVLAKPVDRATMASALRAALR